MAKCSFSKVIDREATKVLYTFRNVLLAKFARSLELRTYIAIIEKGFIMDQPSCSLQIASYVYT